MVLPLKLRIVLGRAAFISGLLGFALTVSGQESVVVGGSSAYPSVRSIPSGTAYPGRIYGDGTYSGGSSLQPGERIISINGVPVDGSRPRTATQFPDPRKPSASGCQPQFVDQSTYVPDDSTAFLLTHFSQRLDTHFVTRPGLERLVKFAKQKNKPLLYLHEPFTANSIYFYPDCDADAYVRSSIGFFDFSSAKLQHAVVAGGFYEMCLNNTVRQLVQNWQASGESRELTVTYVTDAVYCVAQDRNFGDRFDAQVSAFIRQQPSTTVLLSDVLEQLPERNDAWTFLSRRWGKVPAGWGLYIQFRNELTAQRFAQPGQPTLTIKYLTTKELAQEKPWTWPQSAGHVAADDESAQSDPPQRESLDSPPRSRNVAGTTGRP